MMVSSVHRTVGSEALSPPVPQQICPWYEVENPTELSIENLSKLLQHCPVAAFFLIPIADSTEFIIILGANVETSEISYVRASYQPGFRYQFFKPIDDKVETIPYDDQLKNSIGGLCFECTALDPEEVCYVKRWHGGAEILEAREQRGIPSSAGEIASYPSTAMTNAQDAFLGGWMFG